MIRRRKKTPERTVPHTRLQSDAELTRLYRFESKLGEGTYGVVYRATQLQTQTLWALKEIHKPEPGHSRWNLLDNEIQILQKVDHPNIVLLSEVLHTAQKMYLVLELCSGGDLKQLLQRRIFLTEHETRAIVQALADVLLYLHRRDIAHRDLKLENILLKNPVEDDRSPIVIKVADFGLALQCEGGLASIGTFITQACGTHTYMAPEVMSGRGYSQSCDMWSLGVIMYLLLCGQAPFEASSKSRRLEKMKRGVEFPQTLWASVSHTAQTVLPSLLSPDPVQRITAFQMLQSPWITGDFSRPLPPDFQERVSEKHAEGSVSPESSPREHKPHSPVCRQNEAENGVCQKLMKKYQSEALSPKTQSPPDVAKPSSKRKMSTVRKKRNSGPKNTVSVETSRS